MQNFLFLGSILFFFGSVSKQKATLRLVKTFTKIFTKRGAAM